MRRSVCQVLAPDNMAHTITLGGGVNLPMRTRLTGNFSYSLQLQNQDFLPQTINPTIAGDPSLVLPQNSLNGNVQTILLNLGAVTRPIRDVTLTAKYRLFDYSDHSGTSSSWAMRASRTALPTTRSASWIEGIRRCW